MAQSWLDWHVVPAAALSDAKREISAMTDTPVRYTCLRCGHQWFPRSPARPMVCPNPKCHSYRWDQPREEETR